MAACVIVRVEAAAPETFGARRARVAPAIEPFGGEYPVRGGGRPLTPYFGTVRKLGWNVY